MHIYCVCLWIMRLYASMVTYIRIGSSENDHWSSYHHPGGSTSQAGDWIFPRLTIWINHRLIIDLMVSRLEK